MSNGECRSQSAVSEVFDCRPFYCDVSKDRGERRDFTVTVAGSERHDGELPYRYVVSAESQAEAWTTGLTTHMRRNTDVDCYVVGSMSFEGVPDANCGYNWIDLRQQDRFWAVLQELRDYVKRFNDERAPYLDEDGYIKDESQADHDHLLADFESEGFEKASDLADYAEFL
ncbi:hypothetical protein [Streptomyces sp. RTd22]|uniref:hypothetical protein n=1 Tax=Streptomyces sp. RTd22 TaxID=1841249 RepID=UPI0007C4E5F4|nr:hypothetical protein [Streptomyces sp. RTd22]